MANPIYYCITHNPIDNRIELHVSHKREEVKKLNAFSKSIPADAPTSNETICQWEDELLDRFGAIEVPDYNH
jgi:hypothetical protein